MKSLHDSDYDHILNINYDEEFKDKLVDFNSMILSHDRKKVSLNGLWNFSVDLYNTCIRKRFFEENYLDQDNQKLPVDFDFDKWEKACVPFCLNTFDKEFFWYEGDVIFTRKFEWNQNKDERVFLKIGAVNYESKVFLNGKFIGSHIGGYTPYYIEVTDYLNKENRILIISNNERRLEGIPSINTDWFNYGGLQRDIELIVVEPEFIKDAFVYLEDNKIICQALIDGQDDEITLKIPELSINETATTKYKKAVFEVNQKPDLWEPSNPKLYEVIITYKNDTYKDFIGFRKIEVKNNDIYLNDKKILLKGICMHEESSINGRALTQEERIQNLKLAKELGCNAVRLAHYPHHENMARLADEMGLLVWEEVPVYWALQFRNIDTYNNAQNQLKELIIRDRNRASVIIWSVGNENPDKDDRLEFMKNLSITAKTLDTTRLVAAACLVNIDKLQVIDRLMEYIDIVGINEYYGWYYRDFSKLSKILENSKSMNRPLFITEMGAGALSYHHGNELFTEDYQNEVYKNQTDVLSKSNIVKGIFPWILYDFRTPVRLNDFQKYYNRKGLLNPEKDHKKLAFYTYQKFEFSSDKKE